MTNTLDKNKLNQIIRNRIINVPRELKESFPDILKDPALSWVSLSTDSFLMVIFTDNDDMKRIEGIRQIGFFPFPGLILQDSSNPSAFNFNNSRNIILKECTVDNMFSLNLGEDCSIILINHHQSINTKELGFFNYVIKLAYILSFGILINHANVYDHLDDLIAYSINNWMLSKNGK